MTEQKTFYTHAGRFHADEIGAFVILTMAGVCDKYERLTDLTNIPTDGIVGDIGRVYDPEKNLYDHHQAFYYRPDGGVYATMGMIWKDYGRMAIDRQLGGHMTPEQLDEYWQYVDVNFIQAIDANDADSDYYEEYHSTNGQVVGMSLSRVLDTYNYHSPGEYFENQGFLQAVAIMTNALSSVIGKASSLYHNKIIFKDQARFLENGRIVVVDATENFDELLIAEYPDVLFVVQESNHPGNTHALYAIRKQLDRRELRAPIERVGGFEEFIHLGKFVAGSNSKKKLIKLAKDNLKLIN
jgi:uncharacterized UPF0160 family protein